MVLQRCGSWPYVLLRYVRFLGSISVRLKKFFVHRCCSVPLLSIIRLSTSCRYGSSYITTSFFVCPVKHRLSRPPPDTPRPRDHATTTPRGSPMYHRRKIGRQRRTRRAGSVERCSWGRAYLLPVMAGAHKNMEIPIQHSNKLGMNVLTYCCMHCCAAAHGCCMHCCAAAHGGWVRGWVGCCMCCCCTAIVLLLYMVGSGR